MGAAHRKNQDLRIEAQSLQFQLDQLSQLHPSNSTASDELRDFYKDSIKSIQLSAERDIGVLDAEHVEYQRKVQTEMQAAVLF